MPCNGSSSLILSKLVLCLMKQWSHQQETGIVRLLWFSNPVKKKPTIILSSPSRSPSLSGQEVKSDGGMTWKLKAGDSTRCNSTHRSNLHLSAPLKSKSLGVTATTESQSPEITTFPFLVCVFCFFKSVE